MSLNQPVGVPFQNPTDYKGPEMNLVPIKRFPREPLTTDKKYRIGQHAIIGRDPSTGTEGELWYLAKFESNGDAIWMQLDTGTASTGIDALETDDGPPAVGPDISGEVNVLGGTGIITFGQDPSNTVTIGLDGSVVGQTITGDSGVPISPTAGNWNIFGSTVPAGSTPIETNGAASTLTINVQISQAVPSTDADTIGLSNFDDTDFNVDANGFVALALNTATTDFTVDTAVPAGVNPVAPNGSGLITFSADVVAAASIPIQTITRALNSMDVEVQVASTVTGAPGNTNAVGLAQFESTQFEVDSDGYVTSLAGPPVNPVNRLLEWDDFLATVSSDNRIVKLGWERSNVEDNLDSITGSQPGHPGIWALVKSGTIQAFIELGQTGGSRFGPIYLGGGIFTITWIVQNTQLSGEGPDYTVRLGLNDINGAQEPNNNGIWFEYTDDVNSGNYTINTKSAGSKTTANTSTAANTDFRNFTIVVNAAASSVGFFIDGTEVNGSPITTTIPITRVGPWASMKSDSGGTGPFLLLDLVMLDYQFTTPR